MKLFCQLFLVIISCFHIANAQDELTILSYNIYNGFQGDTAVIVRYLEWINEIDPDIVAYQEMSGFTSETLEYFSTRYDHPYSVLLRPEGNPVAITSRYPITHISKQINNLYRGFLYAMVNEVHIFIVHLSASSHKERTEDLRTVINKAAKIPKEERILIVGDFNALDISDAHHYGSSLLNDMIKRDSIHNQANLNKGALDYSVMNLLPSAGYWDTYWVSNDQYQYTLPTLKYRTRSVRRIDYMWANESLRGEIFEAGILVDEDTEEMSDHYPIYVKLKLK